MERQKRVKEELAQLEAYLASLRASAQSSLAALQAGGGAPALSARLDAVRVEDSALQRGSSGESDRVALLEAQCAALRDALQQRSAPAEPSSESAALAAQCETLQAALAAAAAREAVAAASLAALRTDGGANTSHAGAPGSALAGVQAALAALREDKEALETAVVEMYESLFSDGLIRGVVGLLRKKEAALTAGGGDAGAGGDAGGRPAPKMKARLDEARAQVDALERELALKGGEIGALQRHHDDVLKIQRLESEGQIALYKVS